jgi:hypothetical protein
MNNILSATEKVLNDKNVRENVQKSYLKEDWVKIQDFSRSYVELGMPGRMTMIRRENMN